MSIAEAAARIRENIQQVIVGKTEVINLAIACLLSEGHILLEDVGNRQNHAGKSDGPILRVRLPAYPVYPRPAAPRCHRSILFQPETARI